MSSVTETSTSDLGKQGEMLFGSDSAIDLPEAEDVFDNLCDRGFRESREIRTAFFHPVRLLAGSEGHFQSPGRQYPLLLERMSGEK